MIEIERKFLVHKALWDNEIKGKGSYLRQGYISSDPQKVIRVRIQETDAFLTIKGKNEGIARAEFEYSIPVNEAEELLNQFTSANIEKIRYKVPYKGKIWEVDEFMGENSGLIVAEIELQSVDEIFELPSWIANEVSDDNRYYNSNLSIHPYSKWK